jgi:hypothetical protein
MDEETRNKFEELQKKIDKMENEEQENDNKPAVITNEDVSVFMELLYDQSVYLKSIRNSLVFIVLIIILSEVYAIFLNL